MGNLFGKGSNDKGSKSSKAKPNKGYDSKDKAILDLKNAKDRLKKLKKKLEIDSSKLTEQAKILVNEKKKDRALLVLKLRKFKENQLQQLDNQLLSVMEMIENVEWEYANMEVLKALQSGNAALNSLHDEMSVEDVEQLLQETQDAIQMEQQINDLLSSQANFFDQADLEKELQSLVNPPTASPAPIQSSLPDAPTSVPSIHKRIENNDEVREAAEVVEMMAT